MIIHLKDSTNAIADPKAIWKIAVQILNTEDEIDQDKEHFWVFHLDSRNKIKFIELVSMGTLNASIIHPREVFCRAVRERSHAIIIAHNHPSGSIDPSKADSEVTKKLRDAGEILGIELLDHLIVTSDSFMSFKEKSLI